MNSSSSDSPQPDASPSVRISQFNQPKDPPLPKGTIKIGDIAYYEGSPNFSDAAVLMQPDVVVLPGQFLCALHVRREENLVTILQVADCIEINPNETPELSAARDRLGLGKNYGAEGVSTRIYRLAICTTVEELRLKPGGWSVVETYAPRSLLRSADPVIQMPDELIAATLGISTDPDAGLHVGEIFGVEKTRVVFSPSVLQLGVFATGNPGKGKSYFCGVLIEEAHAWDVPILAIDVNGELVETARDLGGLVVSLPDKTKFGLTLKLLTSPELISITPGVQEGTQYAELIELAHEQLKGEKQGDIGFDDLVARIESLGEALDVKKPSIKAAVVRVQKLKHDPLFANQFDFIGELKKHKLIVLDCRYLSLRQTRLIAAAAARTLQQYGRRMTEQFNRTGDKEAGAWFAALFVDEAHTVAPNDERVVSTQVIYELARMGRHVRTGLIFSSQSPADLDPSVLKRLQTRFIFALERDQLKAIPGINADLPERLIAQLPKLPRGVCAVSGSSEHLKHGILLGVRQRRTSYGGATPQVFGGRTKRKAAKPA